MSSYIQNYGFTKTLIQDNLNNENNEIHKLVKWKSDYDGKMANINIDINNNGIREIVNMKLNNNELKKILGIQPVEIPLEKRLMEDFLYNKPINLEGVFQKSRKHRKKHNKKRKTKRL